MKEAIKQRATELGFDDCRFTTADRPESASKLQQWLAKGMQGEMGYMQRNAHKRVDPEQVLPGAKSIISLAVSYAGRDDCRGSKMEANNAVKGKADGERSTRNQGVIARYARYEDYHK